MTRQAGGPLAGSSHAGVPKLTLVREPPPSEDAALFARIADGDKDAFAELYRLHFAELFDFAARITRDREAAADIVQSVFAGVWERVRAGEEVRSPRAWLYRVTHNAAIDEVRRRGRIAQPDEGFDFAEVEDSRSREPVRAVMDKELAELVWSTAASLTPEEYALLDLHVRRDLAPEELAGQLGITTGALYTRMSRLRRSFEEALSVKLLARRGVEDCEELAELVSRLGERLDTPEANKLLGAHIRDCPVCQESRRRFVTASEILAGIAPVPLLPGVQDAVWSQLGGVLGLHGQQHPGASNRSPRGRTVTAAAHAHPVAAAALSVVAAAVLAAGVWAVQGALFGASPAGTARDPSLVWSPTHHPGGASSENRVRIVWSRQPAALAYSVLWSHAPKQEPDTTPDLRGSATGTTSPPLAPGRWYFHLRTQGRDRGWTHTVHLGPFVVIAPASPAPPAATPAPSAATPAPSAAPAPTPAATPAPTAAPTPPAPTATPAPTAPARDTTPPSGQTVELAGGPYYRDLAVTLVLRHGVDRESGVDPAAGLVQRLSGVLADGACGRWSDAWRTVELHRSTDATVAGGHCYRYRYRATDRAGNRSAFSRPSGVAMVDTAPPSPPALSLSGGDPSTFVAGTTVFIRPDGAGSFAVAASSADDGSGVAAIEFPGLADGGLPTRRTAPPYTAVYTWTGPEVSAGAKVVRAYDRAGNAASAAFTLAADATPPAGASVTLAGGPWFAASVPLNVAAGSDSGSGVDRGSVTVERQSAPLQAGGGCGAFGDAWAPVILQAGADAGVQNGRCYRYRAGVSDNVGNRSTSPVSGEARIDATAPSPPSLTLSESSPTVDIAGATVFYRPGAPGALTVTATTADAESGIEQVQFPALAGAGGGGNAETAPYVAGYAWAQALTAAGPQTVTARNRAGLVAGAVFTLAADADPPAGMSVTLLGGPTYPGAAVPIRVEEGSDAGSGVDRRSVTLERDSAPQTAGGCGSYTGVWGPLPIPGAADTTVVAGNCYRYRVSVSDNVGNRATSPPSPDAIVGK